MEVRAGTSGDVAAVLAMLDNAVRWLVERGRVGQWGTELASTQARRIDAVTGWANDGSLYLACVEGVPAGALAVGTAPAYVPPATEPELYVNLLVTGRSFAGRGVGTTLLGHARDLAVARGIGLLRVDCYAGGDRALVRYYERAGFTATEPFTVGEWPGQVLEQRLV
ncbi:GNAT family N-acetyltransferase [Micromonospora sp. CPCC 206061]|uniref:GNAT family N-acetyltransferase n=1 Tax=Micromonospora sp. CPCC 206061 TaxID=3122410 RepID=UPI002FF3707B